MRADEVLGEGQNDAEFKGVKVRKGTARAFIHNVRIINDSSSTQIDKAAAFKDIEGCPPGA
jgi:hypothetical protein